MTDRDILRDAKIEAILREFVSEPIDHERNMARKIWAAASEAGAVPDRVRLRQLVAVVWNEATESTAEPDTPWADRMIDKVFAAPPAPVEAGAVPVARIQGRHGIVFTDEGLDAKLPSGTLLYAAPPSAPAAESAQPAGTMTHAAACAAIADTTIRGLRAKLEAEARVANEWADMATNGIQWLRNIRDGISMPAEALAEMESNLARIRTLQETAAATADAPCPECKCNFPLRDVGCKTGRDRAAAPAAQGDERAALLQLAERIEESDGRWPLSISRDAAVAIRAAVARQQGGGDAAIPSWAPERIYLIETGEGVVWCDCPSPAPDIDQDDAVEYVRAARAQRAEGDGDGR